MTSLPYRNSLMLAPMVRIGTLPSRLLALHYGADLVYGEELIDFKMLKCRRVLNQALGTVDFQLADGTLVFRTCEAEKSRLVFQLGTASPERAVKVAKLIEEDVSAIDINMGCPKDFSLKGGMGAALLQDPDKAASIIHAIAQSSFAKPVTCKIRLLPTLEETLSLAKKLEAAGAHAIGVHGRLTAQRPREPVTPEQASMIKAVCSELSIPVIANGGALDIKCYDDVHGFKESTGCSSVMLARSAQWNMSVFRKEGLLDPEEVAREYTRLAVTYDNPVANSKYCLQSTLHTRLTTELGKKITSADSMLDLASAFGLADFYEQSVAKQQSLSLKRKASSSELEVEGRKRCRLDDDVISMPVFYRKSVLKGKQPPKSILIEHCRKSELDKPEWETFDVDKKFVSVCSFNGKKYASTTLNGNKKSAEHAAALVAILDQGLLNPDDEQGVREQISSQNK